MGEGPKTLGEMVWARLKCAYLLFSTSDGHYFALVELVIGLLALMVLKKILVCEGFLVCGGNDFFGNKLHEVLIAV